MPQDSRGFASDPFDIGFDTVSNIRNYGFDETVPLIIRYTPPSLSLSLPLYIYIFAIVESVATLSQLARYVSRLIMEIPLMANLGYVSINVYTLAIQFRNLSRGLSCTVIVIDVGVSLFFQMLQFPMNRPTLRSLYLGDIRASL